MTQACREKLLRRGQESVYPSTKRSEHLVDWSSENCPQDRRWLIDQILLLIYSSLMWIAARKFSLYFLLQALLVPYPALCPLPTKLSIHPYGAPLLASPSQHTMNKRTYMNKRKKSHCCSPNPIVIIAEKHNLFCGLFVFRLHWFCMQKKRFQDFVLYS